MINAVVTGMGAITPSGNSADTLWESVRDGRSAIDVLAGEEFASLPVRIGGQVRDFDPLAHLPRALARRLSPVQHWAIAAADEALAQAVAHGRLPWDPTRVAVLSATGSGPIDAMQAATRAYDEDGARGVPLTLSIHGAADGAGAVLSQRHGIRGTAHAVSATCASGGIALGEGMRLIRHGYADAVLVVGMEDCLGPVNLSSNANLRALAAGFEDDPTAASRPFDRARTGFVMSAGAAAIVLESEDIARERGATALARLVGFGASSDAHHPTAPHPAGRGAAQAVRACLADAGVDVHDPARAAQAVGHVNAHGTGTPAGDAAEAAALTEVLGPRAGGVPVTATKSSTGHLLGAAGVVEAVLAVRTLTDGVLPPTLNLDDPEFADLDVVGPQARPQAVETVLSTSFGFGGHNAALLLERST
ncbi:beta-ketoacyl-[acyl-carrier-protein] synthase family protein [Brevibacterium senegalense]|uniref:beta-ketoacyl-[acyl-carrier-protein] synthase family protein n=1 Tax=Brevibacterium senegalense TaxID=1033736 RepID=UPI0003030CBE|nr:beta-ketoacyl-[acyl-carrier-protein] synthase family protein [Brevibacterium senegalense]